MIDGNDDPDYHSTIIILMIVVSAISIISTIVMEMKTIIATRAAEKFLPQGKPGWRRPPHSHRGAAEGVRRVTRSVSLRVSEIKGDEACWTKRWSSVLNAQKNLLWAEVSRGVTVRNGD